MDNRRTVIIAVAVGLAAIAFIGNLYYLNGVDQRAYGNAKLVNVFVVTKAIPKGFSGDQAIADGYVRPGKIPQQYRPGSALTRIEDVKAKVAITAFAPGQVVVNGQFVDAIAAQVTFAQRVPPGQVAVTISVDQVHAVAGFVMPGDKVNILAYGKDPGSAKDVVTSRVMYQNVNILAVGSTAAPQPGETPTTLDPKLPAPTAVPDSLITLAVPMDAAERIILPASGSGGMSIYLVLVPGSNLAGIVPAPVDTSTVFNNLPATPYSR